MSIETKAVVKELILDAGLLISGVLMGVGLAVGQNGAPVKLGPITVVKKESEQNA